MAFRIVTRRLETVIGTKTSDRMQLTMKKLRSAARPLPDFALHVDVIIMLRQKANKLNQARAPFSSTQYFK